MVWPQKVCDHGLRITDLEGFIIEDTNINLAGTLLKITEQEKAPQCYWHTEVNALAKADMIVHQYFSGLRRLPVPPLTTMGETELVTDGFGHFQASAVSHVHQTVEYLKPVLSLRPQMKGLRQLLRGLPNAFQKEVVPK